MSPPIPARRPRLGVLFQGMGAVTSTVVAGILAAREGLGQPVGSLSQMGHLDARDGQPAGPMREVLPLVPLDGLVFGGWDIFGGDLYDAAVHAEVLDRRLVDQLAAPLKAIRPMPGAFDPAYVRRLNGTVVKSGTRREWAEALRADIRAFKAANDLQRCVVINCSSTEAYLELGPQHETIEAFERALDEDDPHISPAMIYAWAALMEETPYANGTPSPAADIPALAALAEARGVPVAGKDFKTGQTLMKTVLAPMLRARMLGLRGWFSTNILGNRDGEVLDEPGNFEAKERTKLGVLDHILEPERHPELYGEIFHKVRINYYPPRGDAKEGWDNIDLFGWLGYPMQIKVDFLCRDSILAAPIVLDLALFLDLAARNGRRGVQTWLSFYWKSPQVDGGAPVHDLFAQRAMLDAALDGMRGSAFTLLGVPVARPVG